MTYRGWKQWIPLWILLLAHETVWAQDAEMKAVHISLKQVLQTGGVFLWIIMGVGILAGALALYYLLTVSIRREVPATLLKRVLAPLHEGDVRGAYQLCEGRDELVACILRVGLRMAGRDRFVIQSAMQREGERQTLLMWQRIYYLYNAAVLTQLLGVLGTVWSMALTFQAFAYDNAQIKGMMIAGNVAKAMITTAAGLVVAIPLLGVYYWLRGRLVRIQLKAESQANEVLELLTRENP